MNFWNHDIECWAGLISMEESKNIERNADVLLNACKGPSINYVTRGKGVDEV